MVKDDIFDYFGFSGLTASELKAKGYMTWAPVQEKGSWISEGDTPTFLNLLDNGLGAHEGGEDGGWGGRKRNEVAAFGAPPTGQAAGPQGPRPPADGNQPDFFPAAQRDFAARLKWSVTPRFADAITSRRLEPNVGQYGSERRCPIRTVMRWP
jgi:hypothetical protein